MTEEKRGRGRPRKAPTTRLLTSSFKKGGGLVFAKTTLQSKDTVVEWMQHLERVSFASAEYDEKARQKGLARLPDEAHLKTVVVGADGRRTVVDERIVNGMLWSVTDRAVMYIGEMNTRIILELSEFAKR